MNRTDIYRQAIKRTFADLYGVSPDTVDVSWTTGKTIVVHCASKRSFIQSSAMPMMKRPSSERGLMSTDRTYKQAIKYLQGVE